MREIAYVKHNIIEIIEERRLKCFGHLKRMRSNRIPNILEWNAEGRRNGKLGEQWKDKVRGNLFRKDLTEGRVLWRAKFI